MINVQSHELLHSLLLFHLKLHGLKKKLTKTYAHMLLVFALLPWERLNSVSFETVVYSIFRSGHLERCDWLLYNIVVHIDLFKLIIGRNSFRNEISICPGSHSEYPSTCF